MFCSKNDVILSISEKTKLLAQKCTQTIRVHHCKTPANGQTLSAFSSSVPAQGILNGSKADGKHNDISPSACFCGIAGSLRLKTRRKSLSDTDQRARKRSVSSSTTTWYVKVSINSLPYSIPFTLHLLPLVVLCLLSCFCLFSIASDLISHLEYCDCVCHLRHSSSFGIIQSLQMENVFNAKRLFFSSPRGDYGARSARKTPSLRFI